MLRLAFAIPLTCALAPAHARDGMKDARDDVAVTAAASASNTDCRHT
jgi:hypothetical protein